MAVRPRVWSATAGPDADRSCAVIDPAIERWLPVVGYEGLYEVSDLGRVRSLPRNTTSGRILCLSISGPGYQQVSLFAQGRLKKTYVHHLVAEAFIGPRPEGYEIRHLDGDRLNNTLANLRYGVHSENELDKVRHGTHHYAKRTHCNQNHEYTPENTGIPAAGGRWCRTCSRERGQERQRRRNEGEQ